MKNINLIAELVVEVLVKKDLHDDLVFVAVVPKPEAQARLLQRVNQLLCRLFNIHFCILVKLLIKPSLTNFHLTVHQKRQ